MYSLLNLPLLHIILFLSPLSLVACECDEDYTDDAVSCSASEIDNDQAYCDNILLTCAGGFPASSDCVQRWCRNNCPDPANCCNPEPSSSCFQSSSNSSAFANCTYIASHINSCMSATTGFATLAITDQASCFCFDAHKSYNGYLWDNAATSCYAAMSTQTAWSTSQLYDYDGYYVGACTAYVDTSTISSSTGSTTATKTSSIPSGGTTGTVPPTTSGPTVAAGTPSPTTTAPSTNRGAKNALEGSGMILSALLIMCCLIMSF